MPDERVVSDAEVLGIMKDGGLRLCEHATTQWISRAYGDDETMAQENLARWRYIQKRIRELANTIEVSE